MIQLQYATWGRDLFSLVIPEKREAIKRACGLWSFLFGGGGMLIEGLYLLYIGGFAVAAVGRFAVEVCSSPTPGTAAVCDTEFKSWGILNLVTMTSICTYYMVLSKQRLYID